MECLNVIRLEKKRSGSFIGQSKTRIRTSIAESVCGGCVETVRGGSTLGLTSFKNKNL